MVFPTSIGRDDYRVSWIVTKKSLKGCTLLVTADAAAGGYGVDAMPPDYFSKAKNETNETQLFIK